MKQDRLYDQNPVHNIDSISQKQISCRVNQQNEQDLFELVMYKTKYIWRIW